MDTVSSNGAPSQSRTPSPNTNSEVLEKPKRRRFSVAEKWRILHEADKCAAGTVGAFLRREGIYSSQLYAWRRERERGDPDAGALRKRVRVRVRSNVNSRNETVSSNARFADCSARSLGLNSSRRSEKSRGALGAGAQEPRTRRERPNEAALELSAEQHQRTVCAALGTSRSTLMRRRTNAVTQAPARARRPLPINSRKPSAARFWPRSTVNALPILRRRKSRLSCSMRACTSAR